MKTCPYCGAALEDEAKFCLYCMRELEPKATVKPRIFPRRRVWLAGGGALRVMREVCAGLSVLHENGIVHRDVKPENVMVEANGRVVLLDFNTSRSLSQNSRDTVVMGTVGFAPPEQLGVARTDARTDVYAAGVMLNVLLTGKHPAEQLAPGRYGRIVRKCTAVNPNDRYPTAKALAAAL